MKTPFRYRTSLILAASILWLFQHGDETWGQLRLNKASRELSRGWLAGEAWMLEPSIEDLKDLAQEGSANAAERLTWVMVQEGKPSHAEEFLQRVPKPDPLLWWAVGMSYWDQDQASSAERAWHRFIYEQPRALYTLLWDLMMMPSGPKEALRRVVSALAVTSAAQDPEYLMAYLIGGEMTEERSTEEAMHWYQEAALRFPDQPSPWVFMARLELRGSRTAEAKEKIERALSLGDEGPASYAVMAAALESEGRGAEALEWYAKAAAVVPGHENYTNLLLRACERYGPAEVCEEGG